VTDSTGFALHLGDGTRLQLPQPPALAEFALPGNGRQFGQFLAFYDGTTQTGALYYFEARTWHLHQPTQRDLFWAQCELLDSLAPSQEVTASMATGMAAGTRSH
jgi:hypothetical protein